MNETTYEERPFIKIPEDIMFSASLNAYEKSVLIALMLFSDDEERNGNTCSPTIKEISKRAKCSISTVNRYLKTLKDKGYLKIEPNYGSKRSNLYILNIW